MWINPSPWLWIPSSSALTSASAGWNSPWTSFGAIWVVGVGNVVVVVGSVVVVVSPDAVESDAAGTEVVVVVAVDVSATQVYTSIAEWTWSWFARGNALALRR